MTASLISRDTEAMRFAAGMMYAVSMYWATEATRAMETKLIAVPTVLDALKTPPDATENAADSDLTADTAETAETAICAPMAFCAARDEADAMAETLPAALRIDADPAEARPKPLPIALRAVTEAAPVMADVLPTARWTPTEAADEIVNASR